MSGSSINLISNLSKSLGAASQRATDDVAKFSATMDPTKPQDLFEMQMRMTRMTVTNQVEMQLMSSIQEMLKSMTQRLS